MSPEEAKEWLMATWTGISPLLAQETILRVPRGLLTPQTLHHALTLLLTVVRVGDWMPRVWTDDAGVTLGAYPIPLLSVPPSRPAPARIDQRRAGPCRLVHHPPGHV